MAANIGKLVELAYSASVDDALWRDWTEELVDQLGSPGALFYLIDPGRFEMCRNYMCFRDRDNECLDHEYRSGPIANDPQMRRVCDAKRSEIYLDVDHVDVEDPPTREYLAWQEARCGTRHHITASVVLPDGFEAGVSVHFSAAQGVASDEVQSQIRALFPHFARALRLGFRHADGVQQSWWDGLSSDQSKALVLLDDAGRVLRSTPPAERVFRRNDGLTVRAGQLQCATGGSEQALTQVIRRACARWNAVASGVCVRRVHARRPYSVSAYPLVQRRRFLAPHGAAALVTIDDPSAEVRGLAPHHKDMLGFTSRQGQVADLLLAGHSLESLAVRLGITEDTARSHLKSLFHKTGTSRRTELLAFLARLG